MEYFAEKWVPDLRLGASEAAAVIFEAATLPFDFEIFSVEKKLLDFVGFPPSSGSVRATSVFEPPTSTS
jgi:hypothetical protein